MSNYYELRDAAVLDITLRVDHFLVIRLKQNAGQIVTGQISLDQAGILATLATSALEQKRQVTVELERNLGGTDHIKSFLLT